MARKLLTLLTLVIALCASPVTAQTSTLPNGVAAGDADQTSVVLWARSEHTGTVVFELATDATFAAVSTTLTAEVSDPLIPVKVDVTGLTAGTIYFYRATDAAGVIGNGTFRTLHAPGAHTGLRFGVSGDWRGDIAPFPSIANADERDLDFFVLHGDTIYADYPSPAVRAGQATTLTEFRLKHAEVYAEHLGLNTLADLRAATNVYVMIDDHEVTNNFAGGAAPQTHRRFAGANVEYINDAPLFETGLQVFQEYNPIRDEFYGETGDPRTANERRLYRYRTFGSDAALFLIDARSFRDLELPDIDDLAPEALAAFEQAAFDPTRTMLGAAQFADLQADLLAAQAAGITWKFVMVPEPIQNIGVIEAADRYEGYAAERTALLRFIAENNLTNVVFVAADIHSTFVNDLFYREAAGGEQIPVASWEITTGSVAFDAPLGPTVIDIAADQNLITEQQRALFTVLPLPARDTLLRAFIDGRLAAEGYDPIGLEGGLIDVELLRGSYLVAHTYGWTEFEIDAATQALTVTTYGIPAYTHAEMQSDSATILARQPSIYSQFIVQPHS